MTDAQRPSGADLARQALAAYKATASTTPTPAAKKKTRPTMRVYRGGGRDPQGLGGVLGRLTAEQGWSSNLDGGSILDQWETLCPQYVGLVQAVAYDETSGRLDLRPGSHSYAAQLRLLGGQLAKQINDKLGRAVVRTIRVLPVGNISAAPPAAASSMQPTEAPARTPEDGCPGYQDARATACEHRPPPPLADPYVERAMRRQEAALRAGRAPETEHRDAAWETDRLTASTADCGEAVRRAAIARKRREQAGSGQVPRRAFDGA